MNMSKKISVVVPLYNEEGNVVKLHEKIVSACKEIKQEYEIIFVDDGSKDNTVNNAKKLSPLILIELRKNFGQTAAFDAGFKASSGDIIVTMDGDLQNDPSDIPLLLDKMDEGYDIVSGWRKKRKDSLEKKIFSRTANLLRKILLKDSIHDSGCSLKAIKRKALEEVDLFGEMHRFIPAILEFDGWKVGEIEVSHHPRIHGKTKYNWKRGLKGFVDMVFIWFWRSYSSRPIHFFGGTGLVFIFAGSLILLWMLIEKFALNGSISERIWPLMGVFIIILGVQFLIFGLLADIIIKNYYKIRNRMNYSIKNVNKL